MKNKQKGFATLILITVIILLILGGGMYVYLQKNTSTENMLNENEITTLTKKFVNDADKSALEDKDSKGFTYVNKQWGFSFELPAGYKVGNDLNPDNSFGDNVTNYDTVDALYTVHNSTFISEQHEFDPFISIKITKNIYVQNNDKKIFNSPEQYVGYLKSQDSNDHNIYKNSKVTSYNIGTNKVVKFFGDTGEMPGGGENIPLGKSYTIVFHAGYIYEFSYWINDPDLTKNFDKIMSTLKFVN